MTKWAHFRAAISGRKGPSHITVVRSEVMTEREIDKALREVPDKHPVYRAFMNLLENAREEAVDAVAEDSMSATAMAMHSGGAKYLRAVRDDVLRRRSRGETSNVQ